MARPERNNVDYFPFICKEGKTMYYIEDKYKNDGFATWIKILRQLAVTDYHYLNLSNRVDIMFLSSKCKVSEDVLISIINDLCDMGEFEPDLWHESRILFSVKFVAHIEDAYEKRKTKCISLPGLLTLLDSLGIRKLNKLPLKGDDNTQSKVKESKVKESKVNESKVNESKVNDTDPLRADLPEIFLLEDVKKAWAEWEQYKKEKKQKLTPSSVKKQMDFLDGRAGPQVVAIINQSILNGWAGLFELKDNKNGINTKNTRSAEQIETKRTYRGQL
jgi:uncharacterized protein DUF4373